MTQKIENIENNKNSAIEIIDTTDTSRIVCCGIDLGTTFTSASILKNIDDIPRMIEDVAGGKYIDSCVYFGDDDDAKKDPIVGKIAKEKPNKEMLIYDAKRTIGLKYDDCDVPLKLKDYPFNTKKDEEHGGVQYVLEYEDGSKTIKTPVDIASLILVHMREIIMQRVDPDAILKVTVTTPDFFQSDRKRSTMTAGIFIYLYILLRICVAC